MIVLSNSAEQTVQPGAAVIFDTALEHTGCNECHRQGTGSVKLRNGGAYEISFTANIGTDTAGTPALVAFSLGEGAILPGAAQTIPTTAGGLSNVSITRGLSICCQDYNRVSVVNTGTAAITVGANPLLFIHRLG